jgi:class 3 adenylate cyclase/tetratricopeptide (TPR) repeat protein
MTCGSCGTENEAGRKFCIECGTGLARSCDSCGSPNPSEAKFCGECGAPLTVTLLTPKLGPTPAPPAAERRLVSVLFADLVGFTAASENRDAEDTRELLSRYFETARQVIDRYGGTIEKFIGDAVMAVWGAPVAQEDDADRAVRAALELVDAVAVLGTDLGAPDLRARVGVLTGEAAVTLGAEGQGMVAGDLVNTASRIQSVAQAGTVLVGAPTKRASEGAIAYESAGSHELKGKSEPMELWRALRVVGLVGTTQSLAVEPPFVGRDRDLRLVKELFNAAAEDRRAQLVSVIGIGGIGKSRLAWEFEKYIDGLAETVLWHKGRCLSYGDGVAFWALAEMIRGRAGMLEDEPNETALPKLRAAVELHFEDSDERRFVERRLAHLLGLEGGASGDQENLFAAARMFFERVAARGPTVLVFEDIHWADSALLDFVEYLHDWSRDLSLFILTLARPELTERRPTWGAGKRNFTSITLEPLAADAMETLLTGPVPGLSDELRERILERAEGVPFYAVETVRMLLDRGLLVREDGSFQLTGEIDTLEVPETLQALIAARLDGLSPDERRVVQNAAVLGRTFTLRGLASVTGSAEDELEPILGSLMRKEVLSLQADPLSPERGQYGFIQDLVKKVAYDTLSKKERKSRHLAAAAYLRELGDDDEVVEVVASHYLDAYRAAPDDPDAEAVKAEARAMLIRAGERGASLGATAEAQSRFDEAAALADETLAQAELLERAGMMARLGARVQEADEHFEHAIELFEQAGALHPAARVEARLAEVMWDTGRLETFLERMDRSFELLSQEEPDDNLAELAAQIGRFMFFRGDLEVASQRIETALRIAEARALPEVFAEALTTKAIMLAAQGRRRESMALLYFALETAVDNDKPSTALRASYNVADTLSQVDRYEEATNVVRDGLVQARRVGNRRQEWLFLGQLYPFFALGAWDEALGMIDELPEDRWVEARQAFSPVLPIGSMIHLSRNNLDEATRLASLFAVLAESGDVQERATYEASVARIMLAQGDLQGAAQAAVSPLAMRESMGMTQEYIKEAWVTALEAALGSGDLNAVRDLLTIVDELPPGSTSQFLQAHAARFRARLAGAEGEKPEADRLYRRAAALFRDMSFPLYLGATLLDQGEWLARQGSDDQAAPLLAEAREIFERLRAEWWLDRVDALSRRAEVPA